MRVQLRGTLVLRLVAGDDAGALRGRLVRAPVGVHSLEHQWHLDPIFTRVVIYTESADRDPTDD